MYVTVRIHGNVHSSDVTWLLKTAEVCVKCSVVIIAISGYLCFLRDTTEEIGSAMGVVELLTVTSACQLSIISMH